MGWLPARLLAWSDSPREAAAWARVPVRRPVTGIWLASGLPASALACASSKVMMTLQSDAHGRLLTAKLQLMACCRLASTTRSAQTKLWSLSGLELILTTTIKKIWFLIWIGPVSPSSLRSVCHHTVWRWVGGGVREISSFDLRSWAGSNTLWNYWFSSLGLFHSLVRLN